MFSNTRKHTWADFFPIMESESTVRSANFS